MDENNNNNNNNNKKVQRCSQPNSVVAVLAAVLAATADKPTLELLQAGQRYNSGHEYSERSPNIDA